MTAAVLPLQRGGSCLPGCGKCCEWLELEVNPAYLRDGDVARWVGLHGIALRMEGERCIARLPIPCTMLMPDKTCGVFGQPSRPQLCAEWPNHPLQLADVPGCGFTFEDVA